MHGKKTAKEQMERAWALRDELFDIANDFAGDETGDVAVMLHCACNDITRAKQQLERQLPLAKRNTVFAAERLHNSW